MSLIAGSYERFVWGFKLKPSKSELKAFTLSQLFSYPSHLSAVRSVAVANSIAASSATDDSVKIYDLSSATEIGSLIDHSATVTALAFYTPANLSFPRNLISAAADGSICIYDSDPFVLLQRLIVHKGDINDLTVHPSGRVALTVGRQDKSLGMVNLIRGRRSFYARLENEAILVKYAVNGERFYMGMEKKVSVHEAEDAKLVYELDCKRRVLCATPGEGGLLFTGGEDKGITAWDTNTGKVAYSIEDAHSTRVKGIVVLSSGDGTASTDKGENPYLIASASSDGIIRVWDIRKAVAENMPNPIAEVNTKSRLTCLAGTSLKAFNKPKLEISKAMEGQEQG